ncbi:hypothetical protein LWI29_008488 [Acer saccharum]|uniref:Fe2OG dioxygenase domain-containing protein n=1 Tax=Acer saccharum TaxID=4024 RepID=A0AA39RVN1_ACESA|nr:hypothetical protein LWI29_008488 [Acer saccharum]
MDKLVSIWSKDQSLPENYIFPPENRPGKFVDVPPSDTIPVIDLSKTVDNRNDTIQQILQTSKEFGFFQVINHGVSEKLINDSMSMFEELHGMSVEDKASLFSENESKSCRLYTGALNYDSEDIHYWRENLKHPCYPLQESMQHWPQNQPDTVGKYSVEVNKLGSVILELICEGLGLEAGYLGDDKLSGSALMSVNHYPPCPNPSLTLGLLKHCDPNLITILLQGDVSGLQVFKDGQWISVHPLPSAFVVNLGLVLQIISNDKLKSVKHRAVTNSKKARTSAAIFITPTSDSILEPAKALIDASNPQIYKAFEYKDFLNNYIIMADNPEKSLQPYKLKA